MNKRKDHIYINMVAQAPRKQRSDRMFFQSYPQHASGVARWVPNLLAHFQQTFIISAPNVYDL